MKFIFIKEVIKPEGRETTAFTSLTWALKSEGLYHLYRTITYAISEIKPFQIGNIVIKKVKLNHYPYGKQRH